MNARTIANKMMTEARKTINAMRLNGYGVTNAWERYWSRGLDF